MNEILKKRIEEASEHFAHLYPKVSVADVITFRRDAFQEGAIYTLQNQWISVEEALPDNQDYVLAGYKDSLFMAWYRKHNNMWHNIYGIEMDVDRWMPIPGLKLND